MTWKIREATTSEADFAAFAAVVNEVTPENPTSLEELRWQDATFPGTRFVAELDGIVVGVADVGRIYMYGPEYERYWATVRVREAHRRQGIGSALLAAASRYAREAGKVGLQTSISERHADGLAFLARHNFVEIERDRMVRLDLSSMSRPAVDPPSGIALTSLAERPDLLPGVHAVAEVAFGDIPHADEPIQAGTLEEFRVRDVERPGISPEAFKIAVDEATGEVVGYASLLLVPSRPTMAWHDMTAVARSYRGRGIAAALKHATIAWAIDAGLTELETGNDTANAPMRAINARLGYEPIPDEIGFRGPLTDEPPAP